MKKKEETIRSTKYGVSTYRCFSKDIGQNYLTNFAPNIWSLLLHVKHLIIGQTLSSQNPNEYIYIYINIMLRLNICFILNYLTNLS